ncbi:hypothetical protein [Methylobacterium gregans]|uniref:Uncharacterized protein n=1 Tax=Methylobacterium gregans TaxID=374424 RepID=A0AA37HP27_9HYPH|nr:hypothetical protein [Methylobacterium gregans]MDQ0520376.1 hypothetical protein [Methylobacterium gregans]GJD79031.1 hypothetical protein NBEOAGPD_2251 [Methylobacterium gregans]
MLPVIVRNGRSTPGNAPRFVRAVEECRSDCLARLKGAAGARLSDDARAIPVNGR